MHDSYPHARPDYMRARGPGLNSGPWSQHHNFHQPDWFDYRTKRAGSYMLWALCQGCFLKFVIEACIQQTIYIGKHFRLNIYIINR